MAAQPPRPPPNNLLFCGPPPALPHVLLLPSDAAREISDLRVALDTVSQTNDADALHQINNVGVPIYEGPLSDHVPVFDQDQNFQLSPERYLRRTHSFDVADIYTSQFESEFEFQDLRHGKSEPDLSKYGLFAEVTMECGPLHPPPLVLNNPFYDGTYALDPSQLNQTMVMLPDNYLGFEDSFVPSWDYKPEYIIDRDLNSGLYYDGLPLIPSDDPWSAYCNQNAAFEYYSPNFQTPVADPGGIHYTPLTDLDYAIPQYMGLPVEEENHTNNTYNSINNNSGDINNSTHNSTLLSDNKELNSETVPAPTPSVAVKSVVNEVENKNESPAPVNNVVSEDEIPIDPTNRDSSTQSEESLNADISNDVTSSLAFIPSSKSSQRPCHSGDTSDNTSPCSTDYHEASALDLVQSLDELSCCDSTDFSQSRDDASPIIPDAVKPTIVAHEPQGDAINQAPVVQTSVVVLNQLPAIPKRPSVPKQLPVYAPVKEVPNIEAVDIKAKPANTIPEVVPQAVKIPECDLVKPPESVQNKTPVPISEHNVIENENKINTGKILRPAPVPPAVPPAWLTPRINVVNSTIPVAPPQIRVQNAEGFVSDLQKSPKIPQLTQPIVKVNQVTVDPQPSCSFAPLQPLQTAQLRPEKQPKEVEVS